MKKIYALSAIALSCALSLSASTQRQHQKSDLNPAPYRYSMVATQPLNTVAAMKAPAAKAQEFPSVKDIAGVYDLTSQTLLRNGASNLTLQVDLVDETAGELAVSGWPQDFAFTAYYDETTGVLSIDNNQYLGPDGYGDDNYFYLKSAEIVDGSLSLNEGSLALAATTATFDNNVFTFPADEIWAIGDPNDEDLGWWFLSSDVVLTRFVEPTDPNEGWTTVGNATFQDGWVLPAFGLDQTDRDNWYEVELQQNDNNKNVYRLVDPYHGKCPVARYNQYTHTGYIQFDVTDPDHVVFEPVAAGFAQSQLGITQLYAYNLLTYYMLRQGLDAESVIAALGDNIAYTTFNDGVLTVPTGDARFGIAGAIDGGYLWQNSQSQAINMEVKIFFPGKTPEPEDPNVGWTSVGEATIEDGWFLPGLGIDQTDPANWYKAELQQNDENPNVYRVVDPYKGAWPGASENTSTKTGYIQFDVTDPDHVVFDIVGAGLSLPDYDITEAYCYNTLVWYSLYTGEDTQTLIDKFGNALPYTTFKDGTLLLPSEDYGDQGFDCDALFGMQGAVDGGYCWTNTEVGGVKNMEARIFFPESALTSLAADRSNAEAPVEMFNLQGVRVANPAAGQIVIRRQGTEVSKILVR